jgi:hypothetical protein
MRKREEVRAEGVIVPCAWDEDREIREISLSTTSEVELPIAEELERGGELRAWLRRRVCLRGYLDRSGRLAVTDYEVLEDIETS